MEQFCSIKVLLAEKGNGKYVFAVKLEKNVEVAEGVDAWYR